MYPIQGSFYGHSPYPMPFTTYIDDRQLLPGFPPVGGPMQPPTGFPGTPPPFGPSDQGPQAGPPTVPPPSYIPQQTQQAEAFAVDPGGIRRCLFRFTYVWLRGYQQFWFYPIFVGRTSVTGYRWNGFRWVYFGISLRQIQSFTCI